MFLFVLTLLWLNVSSQEYCEIVGQSKFLSKKIVVWIDSGKGKTEKIKEEEKAVSFNSMIDALNYMDNKGWEFVTAYAVTVDKQNVYHFLLKMKK